MFYYFQSLEVNIKSVTHRFTSFGTLEIKIEHYSCSGFIRLPLREIFSTDVIQLHSKAIESSLSCKKNININE